MNTDTAELEVPQPKPEVKSEVPASSENKPRNLFERARKGVTERSQSIFNAFSSLRKENPGTDLTPEQQQLDSLNGELEKLNSETETALIPPAEVQPPEAETIPEAEGESPPATQEKIAGVDEPIQPETGLEKVNKAADMNAEEIKVDRDIQNAQMETGGEEQTFEEYMKAELRIAEASVRRMKENEVKDRIDGIHSDMALLDERTSDEESRSFWENKLKKDLDWFAENPDRAQETTNYILDQEDILVNARSLPNITDTEKEYIDMMENNLNKIRTELSNRGVSIPDKENNTEHTVYGLVDNPPISIDPETALEYAYHATSLHNIRSIAENGLQPSGIWSKEPGTIFFNAYDEATGYLPSLGVIFRTPVEKIPDVRGHKIGDFENGKYILLGGVTATESAIPVANLEFSFDAGQTWREDMSVFVNKQSTKQGLPQTV